MSLRSLREKPLFEFPVSALHRGAFYSPRHGLPSSLLSLQLCDNAPGELALISIFIEMLSKPLRETHGNQWRLGSALQRQPPHQRRRHPHSGYYCLSSRHLLSFLRRKDAWSRDSIIPGPKERFHLDYRPNTICFN